MSFTSSCWLLVKLFLFVFFTIVVNPNGFVRYVQALSFARWTVASNLRKSVSELYVTAELLPTKRPAKLSVMSHGYWPSRWSVLSFVRWLMQSVLCVEIRSTNSFHRLCCLLIFSLKFEYSFSTESFGGTLDLRCNLSLLSFSSNTTWTKTSPYSDWRQRRIIMVHTPRIRYSKTWVLWTLERCLFFSQGLW